MFRRFRYRRWLVTGLCAAAVVVPSGALAGNNLGAKNGGYGQAVSVTKQAHSLDPAIVKYLLRYGYTESQIAAMSGGALHVSQPTVVDGRSPDTIDFATQAQEPVVTVVREPGFQWDDFGVGFSAALLALVAIGLSRLFSNRGGRRPATSS